MDLAKEIGEHNAKIAGEREAIAEEFGGTAYAYTDGRLAGFKLPKVDREVWRKPDSSGLTLPKKTSDFGKELWKRIDAIQQGRHARKELFDAIGLGGHEIIGESTGRGVRIYWGGLAGNLNDGPLFIRVPWKSVDPDQVKECRAILQSGEGDEKERRRAAVEKFNSEIANLTWEPPAYFEEVPEWQVDKELNTLKEKEKAA